MSNEVIFNEEEHSYTAKSTGKKYTSVTTVIGKYKQPFNKKAVAEAYAIKNGETAEYWIAKWAEITKIACAKGTAFHKMKENSMLANTALIRDSKSLNVYDASTFDYSLEYKDFPDGIYTELKLWSHYFELAGIADIVIIDGEWFDIDDYKTNKKIDKESFRHPKYGYKRMKFPLTSLMDCNYNHYALQLSTYAFMLEQLTGKKCRSICFHHHPPVEGDPTQVQTEGIKYDVPYLRDNVLLMLHVATGKDISRFK